MSFAAACSIDLRDLFGMREHGDVAGIESASHSFHFVGFGFLKFWRNDSVCQGRSKTRPAWSRKTRPRKCWDRVGQYY